MSDPHRGYNPSERPPAGVGGPKVKVERPERDAESDEGGLTKIDVLERGAERDGAPQVMDRRLFMQLLAFDCAPSHEPAHEVAALGKALEAAKVAGVIYEDVNAPRGIALLTWSEDPAMFVTRVRPILAERPHLVLRPELTMLGRTYSQGYEHDLAFWLIDRPAETALNEEWPWAVWYPLRRSGAFAKLEPREQGKILKEHAIIGRAYGSKDLAHDIRLACHGLDARDNEFVIGLVGKNLHPLSHVVQTMRKTTQTSMYISQMGPFFVGRVAYRSKG
jgi:chlorite dismutase